MEQAGVGGSKKIRIRFHCDSYIRDSLVNGEISKQRTLLERNILSRDFKNYKAIVEIQMIRYKSESLTSFNGTLRYSLFRNNKKKKKCHLHDNKFLRLLYKF